MAHGAHLGDPGDRHQTKDDPLVSFFRMRRVDVEK